MALRQEGYPLQKVTLNLRDGDFDRLQNLHGKLGAGKVVRELVIAHLRRVDEALAQRQLILPFEELKQ